MDDLAGQARTPGPAGEERETPAGRLRGRAKELGLSLGHLVDQCLGIASLPLDAPFRDVDQYRRANVRFEAWNFSREPFRVDFPLGRRANPFVGLPGEPTWHVILSIAVDRALVRLRDAEGRVMASAFDYIEESWLFSDVRDSLEMALTEDRFSGPVRVHLSRWDSLGADAPSVCDAAVALGGSLGSGASELPPATVVDLQSWLAWANSATSPPWVRSLAGIADEPMTTEGVRSACRIAAKAPGFVRLALEWALLGARELRQDIGTASGQGPGDPARLVRILDGLVAPERALPLALHRLTERLKSAVRGGVIETEITQPGLGTAQHVSSPPRATEEQPHSEFHFQERLARLAARCGWTAPQRDALRGAIVDAEVEEHWGPSVARLEELLSCRSASPEQLVLVVQLRDWCREEGYGSTHRHGDYATHSVVSYDALFAYVEAFPAFPDLEEAIGRLEEWIDRGFVDPAHFGASLLSYLESPEAAGEGEADE
jgi:hypothetical protein